ncbi:MAG: hypothetical protein FRX48_05217 [Lasallia pustulata]|uniref:Uncharacterized protein n=1 Tax=Lasallia pustulata TaxID=136370 RepID=A0A5M8PPJ4_9LECA|nr:MAG: hypothetical protein FRX48_05217 [Lasallia pustulata]
MSYDYNPQDAPRRHRDRPVYEEEEIIQTSNRPRRHRDRPVYEEEEIIETSNRPRRGGRTMDLARRSRDDSDSIEEIQREFPPGEGAYVQRRTTVRDKYATGPGRARSIDRGYEDDYYGVDARRSDTAIGGGRRRGGRDSGRRRGRRSKYESESESSDFESPPPRERRKSLGEQALAALGLGGLAGAAAGGRDRSESRSRAGRSGRGTNRRRRRSSSYDSRSRSREPDTQAKIQQAVKAAVIAGATEAFRSRKEPGGWGGEKGKRILTAAIGAGGIDGLVSGNDPDRKGGRHTIEAVIGGLAGNRLINGPRDNERSRSRGGGDRRKSGGFGLKDLAAGGIAAAGAKALLDRNRSKSRGRRSYSSSGSSYDNSRSPPRKRSSSVGAFAKKGLDKGMAMVGLGSSDNRESKYRDSRYSDRDGQYRDQQVRPRGGGAEEKSSSSSGSDSDLDISSSEEERRHKKMRGKEYLTAGLASVATIHAAHSVYQSYENRQKRRKEVLEGKMSPEEARKKKSKATLQDAASVGIAALGIKGAISEWKEMKEQMNECREFDSKADKRRERRLQRQRGSSRGGNENYRKSEPNLNQAYQKGGYQNGYGGGPRYNDGNPYSSGALPPPPMGPPPPRYH